MYVFLVWITVLWKFDYFSRRGWFLRKNNLKDKKKKKSYIADEKKENSVNMFLLHHASFRAVILNSASDTKSLRYEKNTKRSQGHGSLLLGEVPPQFRDRNCMMSRTRAPFRRMTEGALSHGRVGRTLSPLYAWAKSASVETKKGLDKGLDKYVHAHACGHVRTRTLSRKHVHTLPHIFGQERTCIFSETPSNAPAVRTCTSHLFSLSWLVTITH